MVPLAFGGRHLHAGDPGDQEAVQQVAADKEHRPRQQRAGERPDIGPEKGEQAPDDEDVEIEIHAQHQKLALGEIDHPHHPEDDAEAEAHQPVDRADQQAGGERLDEDLGRDAERRHAVSPWAGGWPRRCGDSASLVGRYSIRAGRFHKPAHAGLLRGV